MCLMVGGLRLEPWRISRCSENPITGIRIRIWVRRWKGGKDRQKEGKGRGDGRKNGRRFLVVEMYGRGEGDVAAFTRLPIRAAKCLNPPMTAYCRYPIDQ